MKSLARNSLYNVIYRGLNLIFPIITVAYVSRILMVEGIGKVASAQNFVTYFVLLASLGLPTYGVKMIASQKNQDKLNKTFSELFFINFIATLMCSLIYYITIIFCPIFKVKRILYFVVGLQIIFNIINVDWFYQGKEEFKYIMLRSSLVKILSIFSIFIFVKNSNDYIIYALIQTAAKVLNYIFNVFNLRKYIKLEFKSLELHKHLKPIFVLFAASIAVEIYTLADVSMLNRMCGDIDVGYYSNARKVIDIVRSVITAICAVYLPRLSYYYTKNETENFTNLINNGLKVLIFLSIPAAIGIIYFADDIVYILFGKLFENSIITIRILSISIITVAFSNFLGYQVLVTLGKERIMLISTIVGAVINVLLNIFLILKLQYNGAAIASVITEFIVTVIQYISTIKIVKINIRKNFILKIAFSVLLMIAIVTIVKYLIFNIIIETIVGCILGVIVYFLSSFIFRNELVIEFIEKLNKNFSLKRGKKI